MDKVPLQVYVGRPLSERLRRAARRRGVPQSRLVRAFIEQGLAQETMDEADSARRLIAIGRGKSKDMASRHDAYLAAEYADQHRTSRRKR